MNIVTVQISLCEVTSTYEFHVLPYLVDLYFVFLGQDILSALGLIFDRGNNVVHALAPKKLWLQIRL